MVLFQNVLSCFFQQWLESQCAEIDEFDHINESNEMFDQIKQVQKKEFHVKQITVNNKAGEPIVDPDLIMKRWKQYGETNSSPQAQHLLKTHRHIVM